MRKRRLILLVETNERNSRRLPTVIVSTLMLAALAGCSTYAPDIKGYTVSSGNNVYGAQAASANGSGANFSSALAREYSSYSRQLYQQRDWVDADYYGRKSQAAAKGIPTPPEENSRWAIAGEYPNRTRTQLAEARQSLMSALEGGAGAKAPAVAARAQKSYDCWVTDTQHNWENITKSSCRADFQSAMAELFPPPAPPPAPPVAAATHLRVIFETGKYQMTPEAQNVIANIASLVHGNPAAHVTVIGKTDTVGSASYNLSLSKRRMETIRDALVNAGVPASQIEASYTGQEQLNVQTPDETADARNRTVNIDVQ